MPVCESECVPASRSLDCDLYSKLSAAEQEIAAGARGEDFLSLAKLLRSTIHRTV